MVLRTSLFCRWRCVFVLGWIFFVAFKLELTEFNVATARDTFTHDRGFRHLMTEEGAAFLEKYNFEADGEYAFRVRAWGFKVGDDFPKMTVRVDGKDLKTISRE